MQWMSVKQFADTYQISSRLVRYHIAMQRLDAYKIGKDWRIWYTKESALLYEHKNNNIKE